MGTGKGSERQVKGELPVETAGGVDAAEETKNERAQGGLTFERVMSDSPSVSRMVDSAASLTINVNLPQTEISLSREPETQDAKPLNPAVEDWRRLGSPLTPVFLNSMYEDALELSGRAEKAIDDLSLPDRMRWRDFQIQLAQTTNPLAADRIRQERDKAFPDIADIMQGARQSLEAGRQIEADALLTRAFPHESSKPEFQAFLRKANLETKEGLLQIFKQPEITSFDPFRPYPNSMNYYSTDGIGGRTLFGARQSAAVPLHTGTDSMRSVGNQIRAINAGGDNELRTTDGAPSFDIKPQTTEEYAVRLAIRAQSYTAPELLRERLDFQILDRNPLQNIFDTRFKTELPPATRKLLENPIKIEARKSLQELEKPGEESLLSMKAERLQERIAHEFSTRDELKGVLKDPDAIKNSLEKLQRSPRFSTRDKLGFIENLERLTDPTTEGLAPIEDRLILAGQMLDQADNIKTIDQGAFKTCAMGVLEKLMYSRNLDMVGRMITDVALAGKTQTDCGTVISIDSDSLLGGANAKRSVPPIDRIRSLASQYFALIGANVRFQLYNKENGTSLTYAHENGRDVIRDHSTNPPGYFYQHHLKGDFRSASADKTPPGYFPVEHPMISPKALLDTYEALTNRSATGIAMRVSPPFQTFQTDTRLIEFDSPEELRGQLEKRSARDFPVILVQPGHVSTIDGFDARTGLADYDNQWGDRNDRVGPSGVDTEALFKISLGEYPSGALPNLLITDDLDRERDSKLSQLSDDELTARLVKATSDRSKLAEACAIAEELKARADVTMSSSQRVETKHSIITLQEALRTGKLSGSDGSFHEESFPEEMRLKMHHDVVGGFGAMHRQIETRMLLGGLLETGGRHKDAEKAFLEAIKLSDQLPVDLIAEHARLLRADAVNISNADVKAWMESNAKSLGDASDPYDLNAVRNQHILTRMRLMMFYSGYANGGTLSFDIFRPDKAAQMTEDLRKAVLKTNGVDLLKEANALAPETAANAEGQDPKDSERHAFLHKLHEIIQINLQFNSAALKAKIEADPNDPELKRLASKATASIVNVDRG